MQSITALFQFAIAEDFVVLYCIFIVGMLVLTWATWWKRLSKLNGQLDDTVKKLKDLQKTLIIEPGDPRGPNKRRDPSAEELDEYDKKVARRFPQVWPRYKAVLISLDDRKEEKVERIFSTASASQYINDPTVLASHLPVQVYAAMPNILTGLGILGTFLGLAGGIHAAAPLLTSASADPGIIREALSKLLDGAALAFVTSIVGIASSMLFLWRFRRGLKATSQLVNQWATTLDEVFRLRTPVKMASLQLKEAKEASTALKTFATDLAVAIGKQTGPHLEELLTELRALRRDRATDSGEMIKSALEKFAEALSRQTGDQFDTLGRTVMNLSAALADSAKRLEETQESVDHTIRTLVAEMKTSMNASANEMSEEVRRSLAEATGAVGRASHDLASQLHTTMSDGLGAMDTKLKSFSTALAEAGTSAAGNLSASSAEVKEAADRLGAATAQSEQMLGHMTRFARDFDRLHAAVGDASRQIVGSLSPLVEASATIRESVDHSTGVLKRTEALVTRIESSTQRMEAHNEAVEQVWRQYKMRFKDVDQSLARVFENLSGSLASYSHQVTEFAKALDATAGDAIEKLAAATGELSATVDDLIEALPDGTS